MRPKAFALDDLVINDGEDWPESVWVSLLRDALGLPRVSPLFASRQGRHPKISGIDRSEAAYLLQTVWASNYATYRRQLKQYLNPDVTLSRRLVAVDYVPPECAPDHVLLAMGPWDVYQDDAAAWHVRDILRPDDLEVDLSGAWWIGPGEGLNIRADFTNLMSNPSFEIDLTEWTAVSCLTFTRETSGYGVVSGCACAEFTTDATNDRIYDLVSADTSAGTEYTFSAYVSGNGSAKIGMWDDVAGWTWSSAITLSETPQLSTITHTFDGGSVSRIVAVASADGAITCRVDAVQLTESAYWVPYRDGTYPGCAWSGTAHDSTTTVTGATADIAVADVGLDFTDGSQGTIIFWVKRVDWDGLGSSGTAYVFRAYADANNQSWLAWSSITQTLYSIWKGAANSDPSGSLTGQTDNEYSSFIITWNFTDGSTDVAFYWDGEVQNTYSDADPMATNPTNLEIGYAGAGNQWNDDIGSILILDKFVSAEEAARFHAMGAGGLNARWLDVSCHSCDPWAPNGRPLYFGLVSGLAVDGDVRWRQRDGDVAFWRVYDDTGEITIDVDSDDEVYPQFRMTPKTAKTTGFDSKYWVPIKWPYSGSSDGLYPVLIAMGDLSAVAQADGDDVRVYVDGEETDRWLGGTLVSDLKVWFNTTFQANQEFTLDGAIGAGDTVTEITVDEDIDDMPSYGILLIDSEAFYYDSKDPVTRTFNIASREYQGTSAAGHADDSTVYWIQHDVVVYCGDSSLEAPDTDDTYKPVFDLDNSTNTSWVYDPAASNCDGFGYSNQSRTGSWVHNNNYDIVGDSAWAFCYTKTGYGTVNPWDAAGVSVQALISSIFSRAYARAYLYNPCGITNANFQTARYIVDDDGVGDPYCGYIIQSSLNGSSWTWEDSNFSPTVDEAWHSWSDNQALTSGSKYVGLAGTGSSWSTYETPYFWVEATKVTITLNGSNTPDVTVNSRQDNYPLEATITNAATGESITVSCNMLLDQQLVVDTDPEVKTVQLSDGTRMPNPTKNTKRRDWLRLLPGENVLSFSDIGTQELEIEVLWTRRLFE